MGNLNANYGSELHLLRWLGLHRDDLTRKVEGVTALTGLQWKQFEFSHGKTKYDAELRNLNFLDPDDWGGGVRDRFSKSIHPNWDAVATGMRNGQKYYVLVEAKAYPAEIADDNPHHGGVSRATIKKELNAVAKEITGFDNLGDLWMGKYYQQANRLYTHWILDQFGIKSILVDIFFCGDNPHKGVRCPDESTEWRSAIDAEYKELHLDSGHGKAYLAEHVRELYIDVRSDRDMMTF